MSAAPALPPAHPPAGAGLTASGRFGWLDVARGVALLAMAIYHFSFDLAMFGLIDPRAPVSFPLREFARLIATSFLLLVGVGLVIGHGRGIRWRPFWRRFALIAGAAGLITAGSYAAALYTGAPQFLIYHGILHMIAIGSLAALPLVRAPWWVAVVTAALVAWVGLGTGATIGESPWIWWTGLSATRGPSFDFVPFFPAFAAVAAGVAVAKLAGLGTRPGSARPGSARSGAAPGPPRAMPPLQRPFAWAGRHSLLVYLAHQPVLIGLLWLYVQVAR